MSAASKVENACDIKSSGTLHSRLPLTKDSTTPVVLRGDVISLEFNPLSAVRALFNIFAAALRISRSSPA